jgi:hypothetical protein
MPIEHTHNIGDRVIYTGFGTRDLVGKLGTIIECSPNGGHRFNKKTDDSVPVYFDDYGYFGVFYYNIELIVEDPTWTV